MYSPPRMPGIGRGDSNCLIIDYKFTGDKELEYVNVATGITIEGVSGSRPGRLNGFGLSK